MKVLVTGAAGFIGSFLCQALARAGHTVVGIDNINDYYDVRLKHARLAFTGIDAADMAMGDERVSRIYPDYRFRRLDVCDSAALHTLIADNAFDVVCHLAAQAGVRYSIEQPQEYISANIVGFFNILEACRRNRIAHLVYASSSSVYGKNEKTPFAEADCTDYPVSLYAATKKSNEVMAHAYATLYGFRTTGLRFFTVYGPYGRPDMAPFLFLDALTEGRSIRVFNHGQMQRDFTYVADIVAGLMRVIECTDGGASLSAIYNIGNAAPVPLMHFIETLERCAGREVQKEFVEMQPGDVPATFADTALFQETFGFKPETPIEVGVKHFYDWYCAFYGVK